MNARAMVLVLEGDRVHIQTNVGVSMTEYSITGPLGGVLRAIHTMFDDYSGLGYGTRVNHMEQLSDSSYGALMSRSNSCE